MNKIIPNLWLDGQAEELAKFYTSIFNNSKIVHTAHYTEAGKEIHGQKPGSVLTVDLEIENIHLVALNGGPSFKVNPSVSFFVRCKTADEVDELWSKLSEGGQTLMELGKYPFSDHYGWMQDKFGVSWQLMVDKEDFDQKISVSLLFTKDRAGQAEEAMNFYAEVFPESKVGYISRYEAGQEPNKAGTVNYGEFTLLGDKMLAMDSALEHSFSFNEGVSLMVECDTQQEIDNYWEKLSAVPEAEACGWLKDKYGVSWQITPASLAKMMKEGSPAQLESVTNCFMKMKKFDVAELEKAYTSA